MTAERDPRDALVAEHLDVVRVNARRMCRLAPRADHDDLVSAGQEALLEAARTFDASRGVPFRSWANLHVHGAMAKQVRAAVTLDRMTERRLKIMTAGVEASESVTATTATPADPAAADRMLARHLEVIARAATAVVMAEPAQENAEDALLRREMNDLFSRAMERLDEKHRTFLELYVVGELSLREVGARMGMSLAWASRFQASALDALARELKALGFFP